MRIATTALTRRRGFMYLAIPSGAKGYHDKIRGISRQHGIRPEAQKGNHLLPQTRQADILPGEDSGTDACPQAEHTERELLL